MPLIFLYIFRSEELETALMEMVEHDNRRTLSAKVEKLEAEVSEMRKAFADKQEQEQAMLQVLAYCTHPLAIIYVFLIIILHGPPGSIGASDWLEISTH